MRIQAINAYRTNLHQLKPQNTSFGKFADEQADKKIYEAVGPEDYYYYDAQQVQGLIFYTDEEGHLRIKINYDYIKTKPGLKLDYYEKQLEFRKIPQEEPLDTRRKIDEALGAATGMYDRERRAKSQSSGSPTPAPKTTGGTSPEEERRAMEDKILRDYAQ